jgi:uncharacterized membrane protein YagU involved in acid resistance
MLHHPARRLLLAGLATGIVDGLFASVQTFFYNSTVIRLWQGVASTLLGKSAYEGGTRTALIGLLMHFGVAFGWSAVFLLLYTRLTGIRRVTDSPGGVLKVAAVYGPLIWMVMSLVVIPLLVSRPPNVTVRWWIQLAGHIFFVGLPIVYCIAGRRVTSPAAVSAPLA